MSVLKYDLCVRLSGHDIGFTVPFYIEVSDKCCESDIDVVSRDLNESIALDGLQAIGKKLRCLERKMAQAIGAPEDTFNELLEFISISLYSLSPVETEPDYVYL